MGLVTHTFCPITLIKDAQEEPVDITGSSYACKVRRYVESKTVLVEAEYTTPEPHSGLFESRVIL